MDALEAALELETGIQLQSSPEALIMPGIPTLTSGRYGARDGESILVLEFADPSDTDAALGGVERLDATRVLRNENVVVLYAAATTNRARLEVIAAIVGQADAT